MRPRWIHPLLWLRPRPRLRFKADSEAEEGADVAEEEPLLPEEEPPLHEDELLEEEEELLCDVL